MRLASQTPKGVLREGMMKSSNYSEPVVENESDSGWQSRATAVHHDGNVGGNGAEASLWAI